MGVIILFILCYLSMQPINFLTFAVVPKMGFSIRILSPFPKADAKPSMQSASLNHSGSTAASRAFGGSVQKQLATLESAILGLRRQRIRSIYLYYIESKPKKQPLLTSLHVTL